MPKIFEYLGIVIFFHSNEHEPVHVMENVESMKVKQKFISLMDKLPKRELKW